MNDDDECDGEHIWRLADAEDSVIRKCAYCLRREIMKGKWEEIEKAE